MPDVITNTLYLEINSTPLATPAWQVLNIETLLDGPDVRGADVILPNTNGVRAYLRRPTLTRRMLHMQIFGNKTRTNATNADAFQGVIDNIAALRTNVVDPLVSGDGTRLATLHFPDATTKTAYVHVISPLQLAWVSNSIVNGVLTLEIPSGSFT